MRGKTKAQAIMPDEKTRNAFFRLKAAGLIMLLSLMIYFLFEAIQLALTVISSYNALTENISIMIQKMIAMPRLL